MDLQIIKIIPQEIIAFNHEEIDDCPTFKNEIVISFGGAEPDERLGEKEHLSIGIEHIEEDSLSVYICLDKMQSRTLSNILLNYANS